MIPESSAALVLFAKLRFQNIEKHTLKIKISQRKFYRLKRRPSSLTRLFQNFLKSSNKPVMKQNVKKSIGLQLEKLWTKINFFFTKLQFIIYTFRIQSTHLTIIHGLALPVGPKMLPHRLRETGHQRASHLLGAPWSPVA